MGKKRAVAKTDQEVVAEAKEAHTKAEKAEDRASPSRWKEADCYAELANRGWKQQKIAEKCETNVSTVSRFIFCARKFAVPQKRPPFWRAYQEVDGKTTAERLVASNENEWYTPSKYLDAARLVLGTIDLDPASCKRANKVVKAKTIYTIDDDSLHQPWTGRLWLNPPYGRLAGEFIRRLVLEYEAGEVKAAVTLVNAHCTDTDWFQSLWSYTLCFTDHRIDFDSGGREKQTSSTHGSVFAYLGSETKAFKAAFTEFGAVVRRVK